MKIEGKVALITGGASGIGKALAQRLLECGIKFVAIIDLDEEDGRGIFSEFAGKFGADRMRFIRCDVTDEEQLRKTFQESYDTHEALDIVVNNAAIISKDHTQMILVNLIPVMNGIIIANDLMTRRKRAERGVIVNTSSVAGLHGHPASPMGYTASKHGIVGLIRAFKYGSDGFSKDLRAVAICPSAVDTSLTTRNGYMTQDALAEMKGKYTTVSMSSVIDAFVRAIEDDTLSSVCIKVELSGTTVIDG